LEIKYNIKTPKKILCLIFKVVLEGKMENKITVLLQDVVEYSLGKEGEGGKKISVVTKKGGEKEKIFGCRMIFKAKKDMFKQVGPWLNFNTDRRHSNLMLQSCLPILFYLRLYLVRFFSSL
jgi:hypothetical protein